jgi:hypothetical protein
MTATNGAEPYLCARGSMGSRGSAFLPLVPARNGRRGGQRGLCSRRSMGAGRTAWSEDRHKGQANIGGGARGEKNRAEPH